MFILVHVILALSSLIASTLLLLAPTHRKFSASYTLTALTLVSGTFLVISTHAPLISSCFSGLLYLGVTFSLIFAARRKFSGIVH